MNNLRDTMAEIRNLFNSGWGEEPFVAGHQILKPSRAFCGMKRLPSEWALHDNEVQKVLLVAFPKLQKDIKQRERAARWAAIIHLFFRSGQSYSEVAEELKITPGQVRRILQSIRRTLKGFACNGSQRQR